MSITADLVINFSGGKDSTVMLAELCRLYPNHPKHVIFADTGWEHGAYDVVIQGEKLHVTNTEDWCRRVVASFGLELDTTRSSTKTFLSMVETRGRFPSAQYRQCTSDLKAGPIETYVRRTVAAGNMGNNIVQCLGIRAAESTARAKQKPLRKHEKLSKAGRSVYTWYPIFDWETEAIYDYIADNKLPLHPVYRRIGGHLDRYSCRFCIFNGPREMVAIRTHDRAAFDTIAALEKKIDFTMNPLGSVIELADAWEAKHPTKPPETLEKEEYECNQQMCLW